MTAKPSLAPIAAALLWAAVTLPANAFILPYTLSGVTATYTSPSAVITFTGDFTFDSTAATRLDSVDITATETSGSGILTMNPETFNVPTAVTVPVPANEIGAAASDGDLIVIDFAQNLGAGFPTNPSAINIREIDVLTLVGNCSSANGACASTAATGQAVPAAPVTTPEPATIALLGGAIGLFSLARRSGRRGRQTRPDHPAGA